MARNGFIAVEVGSLASPVCGQLHGAQTCQTSLVTIWASGLSANANKAGPPVKRSKPYNANRKNWFNNLTDLTFLTSPLRIKAKLCPAAFGVSFCFAPTLLRRRFKRSQASHFIEDAFRVQLAFQPLERAIHWFAFSNNDFWHQFTSVPEKFAHYTPGQRQFTPAVRTPSTPVEKPPKMAGLTGFH